jgi:hypothetical protein
MRHADWRKFRQWILTRILLHHHVDVLRFHLLFEGLQPIIMHRGQIYTSRRWNYFFSLPTFGAPLPDTSHF